MTPTLDTIRTALGAGGPWLVPAVTAGAALAVLITLAVAAVKLRGRSASVKQTVGTAIVQSIVAWIVITGMVAYFSRVMHMPVWPEAVLSAGGIAACTWAGAGRIIVRARTAGAVGWGKAGPFFWGTVAIGGVLAVLGSASTPIAIGRACLIVLDAWLWYLQLSEVTERGTSRWRWTPTRLLVAIGALSPDGKDVLDSDAWMIAKLVRAMRRRNSKHWPWTAIGKRTLDRLGDRVTEKTMAEAMRRYASGRVLVVQTAIDSALMTAAIAAVTASQTAAVTTPPLVVAAEVGRSIGPRPPEQADPVDEPPVEQWRELEEAPVSPPVGGPGMTEQQKIDKWRRDYAEAVTHAKQVWRHPITGEPWDVAPDAPTSPALQEIMARPEFGRCTGKGTCLNIQKVIVADRAAVAGVDKTPTG